MPKTTFSQVLTPPGTGAIAVVRISGPDTRSVINNVFLGRGKPRSSRTIGTAVRYGTIVDQSEVIDDVLLCELEIDGQPVADLCAHGGVQVLDRILLVLERHGAARTKTASQRTQLWPAANRIESEANDLFVHAKTGRAVTFLAWQRSRLFTALCDARSISGEEPLRARTKLEGMLSRRSAAERLIHGVIVVLVGPPNSGKSTLFNCLVGGPLAVTSDQRGTTRDWVSEDVDLGGIPVTLVDTAGRRATSEGLEIDAIERGAAQAAGADLILLTVDGAEPPPAGELDWLESLPSGPKGLLVINKSDRGEAPGWKGYLQRAGRQRIEAEVRVSALRGHGADELTAAIVADLDLADGLDRQPSLFTKRQEQAVRQVLKTLELAHLPEQEKAWDDLL